MNDLYRPLPYQPTPVPLARLTRDIGIGRAGALELLASGYVDTITGGGDGPAAFQTGNGPAVTPAALDALAAVPWVATDRPESVINARVRAARIIDDFDRDIMGWHTELDDEAKTLAIGRWWPTPRDLDPVGHAFVATIGGFVVATGRITSHTTDRGQSAYGLDWNDPDVRTVWAGHRVETPRGGNIVYL